MESVWAQVCRNVQNIAKTKIITASDLLTYCIRYSNVNNYCLKKYTAWFIRTQVVQGNYSHSNYCAFVCGSFLLKPSRLLNKIQFVLTVINTINDFILNVLIFLKHVVLLNKRYMRYMPCLDSKQTYRLAFMKTHTNIHA